MSYDDENEDVTFDGVTAMHATERALLVLIEGKQRWVPQSQITDDSEVWKTGDAGKLVVRGWWARQEGLA